jgi:DNA-binding LacI/PurR family transcriptional regulator
MRAPKRHKRPTLSDVAQAAGVSRWVAGRVLNGGDSNIRCSKATELRIRQTARRLDYHPNLAARQLRGKRSYTLGLLVASAGDPLRSFLVQYLDAEAVKIGCHTLIANTIGNPAVGPDQFDHYVEEFDRRGVDGVFCAVHNWWPGDRAALVARHPKTVFYEDPGIPGAAHVAADRAEAARLAVRHLAGRGRRRIGLALMDSSRPGDVARRRGYEEELAAHRLALDERLIFDGRPHGAAYPWCNESTGKWEFPFVVIDRAVDALVRDGGADAIVAHDDFWAAALIKRIRARAVRVPQDVAVVGYLNHYLADWTDPALTTIDLCHERAARRMVEMLEHMIREGPLAEDERAVQIRPRLVLRESA